MGDKEGKPRNQTGWRASCMYLWKNSGPCFLRPTGSSSYDSPDSEHNTNACVLKVDENGKPVMNKNSKKCENAWADDDNVIHDGPYERNEDISGGPYSDDLSSDEKQLRHNTGWNNQFAFPWEVSAFWNFTTR